MFAKILIGNRLKVVDSSDPTLVQKSGLVIDETRNMLKILNDSQRAVSIPKVTSVFEIEYEGRRIVLAGKEIVGTSEERIHKL